jgi:hypothetical protein
MELTNVRNVKIEPFSSTSPYSLFKVSFECDYTDEFFQEKKSAFVEVPQALVHLNFNGKDQFNLDINALLVTSEDNNFYAKVTTLPETKDNEQKEFVLRAGSVVKLGGLPFVLKEDTSFLGDKGNFNLYEHELGKGNVFVNAINDAIDNAMKKHTNKEHTKLFDL